MIILKAADVVSFNVLNGRVKIVYTTGATLVSVYFTYKSALATTEKVSDNTYSNRIAFRTPSDRPDLFDAIQEYINQKVLLMVTFSSGEEKVFGSADCPLILSYNPTQQGVPEDYNGLEFSASCVDFAPGRFLSDITEAEPVPEVQTITPENCPSPTLWMHDFTTKESISGTVGHVFSYDDEGCIKYGIDADNYAGGARHYVWLEIEAALGIVGLSFDIDSVSASNWALTGTSDYGYAAISVWADGELIDRQTFVPAAGTMEFEIEATSYMIVLEVIRFDSAAEYSIRLNSIGISYFE